MMTIIANSIFNSELKRVEKNMNQTEFGRFNQLASPVGCLDDWMLQHCLHLLCSFFLYFFNKKIIDFDRNLRILFSVSRLRVDWTWQLTCKVFFFFKYKSLSAFSRKIYLTLNKQKTRNHSIVTERVEGAGKGGSI